jgi:hypothetical protein
LRVPLLVMMALPALLELVKARVPMLVKLAPLPFTTIPAPLNVRS